MKLGVAVEMFVKNFRSEPTTTPHQVFIQVLGCPRIWMELGQKKERPRKKSESRIRRRLSHSMNENLNANPEHGMRVGEQRAKQNVRLPAEIGP